MNLVKDFYRREEALRRLIRELSRAPDARMLDVGCRKGEITRVLAEDKRFVAALDLDSFGEWLEPSSRIGFVNGDATKLPFRDDCFDIIVSGECLQYVPEWRRALDEMQRVLRPGGRLVLSCPNGNPIIDGLDPYNVIYWLRRLFKPSTVRGRSMVRHLRPRRLLSHQQVAWDRESFVRRGSLGFIYAAFLIDNFQNVRRRLQRGSGLTRRGAARCLTASIKLLFRIMRLDFSLSLGGLSYNAVYCFRKK
jgi:SAM-dependent methyltransferase